MLYQKEKEICFVQDSDQNKLSARSETNTNLSIPHAHILIRQYL